MPTGSKGLINQFSNNMVAPQVSGQGNTKSPWTILTNKKNKREVQELFKKEDFPPLPTPCSATQNNQTGTNTPTRVTPQKNVTKITPDIAMSKLKESRKKNLKTDEDGKLTASSSISRSSCDEDKRDKENPEEVIKNLRRSLRIKQKQDKIKRDWRKIRKSTRLLKELKMSTSVPFSRMRIVNQTTLNTHPTHQTLIITQKNA